MDQPTCTQQSLDVGEPLFGTATGDVDRWLLLEHGGQWSRDALESPGIPDAVRAHFKAFLATDPRTRFQLIRGEHDPGPHSTRRLFVVSASDGNVVTWEVGFRDPAELAELPLADFLPDRAPPRGARPFPRPLVLVCTHGKRDPCCARLGGPVFRELAKDLVREHPGTVWQTSHVGGHRFAANIVLLPHGYHYGRLDVAAARRVVRGYLAGRLTDLDRLRGRSCYPPEVQAAEFWLRQGAGRYGLEGLRLRRREPLGDHRVGVTFHDADTDQLHELLVVRETTADLASPSCGEAPKPVVRHRLDSYRHVAAP
ncbi:MAG: sucrase ferredoxin [Myxococcota bacterium]